MRDRPVRDTAQLLLRNAPMPSVVPVEVSVIVPFGDDEETIGDTIRAVVDLLTDAQLPFEVLAVDEDSGDNSHAVLAMMRRDVPGLRVIHASARLRGVEAGVSRAQGQALWVVAPSAHRRWEGVLDSIAAVRTGGRDIEIALNRYLVAHRSRAFESFTHAKLGGEALQRRFAKRAAARGLNVVVGGRAQAAAPASAMSWLRGAFASRRAG